MADKINLRPVGETPEVEAISDGDKALIVDANGMAKQIPANKLGGGGTGGGIVYMDADLFSGEKQITATAYTDEALTQPMDYATGKKLLMGGAVLGAPVPEAYKGYGLTALTGSLIAVGYFDAIRQINAYAHGFVMSGDLPQVLIILNFSDTQS